MKELLWDLNRTDRQTMIVVTHDATFATEADRMSELIDGRLEATETA